MRDLALGFFDKFKGADTVLLLCSHAGVAESRGLLVSAPRSPLAIHKDAEVAANHPVQLFAAPAPINGAGFTWLASADRLAKIDASLNSLALEPNGHQYFELAHVEARLMVSLNEYDASWWSANA
jgi:hypothetical protein